MTFALTGATVFDGTKRHEGAALLVEEGRIAGICAPADLPAGRPTEHVDGLLTPGLVDLQVNGGGGVMFNTAPTPETIATIAKAHARLGTTALLPTLITDTPEVTICAAAALQDALRMGVPGVIGLHLEGPHLSTARKGAHDGALIRPMQPPDCSALETLARDLPSLMLTVAPESTSLEQVSRLSAAGAIVSLGHTDTDFEAVQAAAQAGATCITHLFNAMSPFTSRAPGVVGAALETGSLHAGLIADGIHVHPATIRTALRAKRGPGRVFLVSDAMALTGSPDISFEFGGRKILRADGALRLADGTLAGADLDMLSAVRFMVSSVGLTTDEALCMATRYPAEVLGRASEIGTFETGARADILLLDDDLSLKRVWQNGAALPS